MECVYINWWVIWLNYYVLSVPWTEGERQSVLNIHLKDWCWFWLSNNLATWCEELIHWKRPWCWERLKVGGEGDLRGWDGGMASLTQGTWVWASSGNWWWTGKPGELQSMELQRVGHDWTTELNLMDHTNHTWRQLLTSVCPKLGNMTIPILLRFSIRKELWRHISILELAF